MPVIDHLDLATKRIYLAAGVREYHPVADIYREVRALRRTDESLRKFDMPIVASGNVAKGGGKFTPRYATFRSGWKVVPEDTSHTLSVTGEQITDEGESGPAAIDFESLSSASKVVVQYEPPAAEVIVVATGLDRLENLDVPISTRAGSADVPSAIDNANALLKLLRWLRRVPLGRSPELSEFDHGRQPDALVPCFADSGLSAAFHNHAPNVSCIGRLPTLSALLRWLRRVIRPAAFRNRLPELSEFDHERQP